MKSQDFIKEDIISDVQEMHSDHEVQMAREECYHSAQNAVALHKLLKHVSEQQGLEGWVSEKITLANDYLKTVREYLEYELMTGQEQEQESIGVMEDAGVGGVTAGAVSTVGSNLLGGPAYKGPNPFKKKATKKENIIKR